MQYRVYFVDEHEHIRGAADLDALSVADAMERARELGGDHRVELWQIDRFICRFEPVGPQHRLGL